MNSTEIIKQGIALVEAGKLDAGMLLINQSISIDPKDPEKIHVRAQIHSAIRKYDEAISDYKKAIFLKADVYQYHYNLANVYFDLKQFEKAIEYYSSAINLNPNDADIYSNRGTCYLQTQQPILAYKDYKKTVVLNPTDPSANNGLRMLTPILQNANQ